MEDSKRAADDTHRAAEDLHTAIVNRSDFGSTVTCGSHSGVMSDISGLGRSLDSKAKILTWVVGIGVSLNVFVIGICSTYIVGALNVQQALSGVQTSAIAVLSERQQTSLRRLDMIETQIREMDRRIDQIQWGTAPKILHKKP